MIVVTLTRFCSLISLRKFLFSNDFCILFLYLLRSDGPLSITGVGRQVVTTKRVNLTDIKVDDLTRNASQKEITQKWTAQGTKAKWEACGWAKKLSAKRKRASLSDFDRFKVMVAKGKKKAALAK